MLSSDDDYAKPYPYIVVRHVTEKTVESIEL